MPGLQGAEPDPNGGLKKNKKIILDGIRTRNPQIRSLVRYPLRHENLRPLAGDGVYFFPDSDDSKKKIDI